MSKLCLGNEYLIANTDREYFAALNPSEAYLAKLNRLKSHLPTAKVIASLGMAGGEDLCTLAQLYGDETALIGIDISPVALDLAQKATQAAGVEAEFMQANATNLDLPNRSIDGFVLSAIMHEVYSYADDGKDAFTKALQEAYRKTSEDGCIFISDFAAPRIEGRTGIVPKTHEAAQFIDYFVNNFRRFSDVAESDMKPAIEEDTRQSTPAFASEVLWHFKHYKKKFHGELTPETYPQGWKEINESYLPLNPLAQSDVSMPINDYVRVVEVVSNIAEVQDDFSLECVSTTLTPQKESTLDMLDEHFEVISDNGDMTSRELIKECTNWMDLVFKKRLVSSRS